MTLKPPVKVYPPTWNRCPAPCGRPTRKPKGTLCRVCQELARETPEKRAKKLQLSRESYQRNKAAHSARTKAYRERNLEKVKAKNAEYRAKNAEYLRSYVAVWRLQHPGYDPRKERIGRRVERDMGTHCMCDRFYLCKLHLKQKLEATDDSALGG